METLTRTKTTATGAARRPRNPDIRIAEKHPPLDTAEFDRDPEFVAEFLKAQFVEDVLQAMEAQGLNKNTLAARLGKRRQYVGQILNEKGNFTIKTMAEISCALGRRLAIRAYGDDEVLLVEPRKQTRVKGLTKSTTGNATRRPSTSTKRTRP